MKKLLSGSSSTTASRFITNMILFVVS